MRNSTLIAAIVGTIVTYFSFKSGLVGSGPATPPIARPVSLDQKLGSSSNMTLRITSLGSSFAAGPNIPPVVDAAAARSGANYAHLLSDRIGATLTDLSVSGATLLNLLDQPQDRGGHRFPPQITAIPADTDVVLVLGGGNDMYYIGGLMEDTLSRAWGGSLVRFYSYLKGGNPHREAQILLQSDVDAVATRYAHVLDAIHRKLPAAKVFIIEYQAILGPDTRPGQDVVFDADRIAHHRQVAANLARATRQAATGREKWCSIVDITDPSESHAVGSSEPWIAGFTWSLFARGGAYHPLAGGMTTIADLIYQEFTRLGLISQDDSVSSKGGEHMESSVVV